MRTYQVAVAVVDRSGRLPIRVVGHFYGAIGVSGAPGLKFCGDEDEVCAKAGLATIAEALEFAD